jgi:hypothetical protein
LHQTTKGCPLTFIVTGGQAHDSQVVEEVLSTANPPSAVSADKAYDSQRMRQQIKDEGALPVIASQATLFLIGWSIQEIRRIALKLAQRKNPTRACHRMLALAPRSPGRGATRSSQKRKSNCHVRTSATG